MRKMFRGYYYPNEEDFSQLWKNGIFIFDANILLNIYRYSKNTRELFLKILDKISDRIIIPHQAAKEYQINRFGVIRDQRQSYKVLKKYFEKEKKSIIEHLNKREYTRHPFIDKDRIIEDIDVAFKTFIDDLNKKFDEYPDLYENDDFRDKLDALLGDKIWKPFPKDEMKKIEVAGKERYKYKIPPGFEDKDKEGFRKYGDLILWYQILDIAKKKETPIIFVTDDSKSDWWWKCNNRTIGPKPELIEEIYEEANVLFYMYTTNSFIKRAEKIFFDSDSDPVVLEEVKDISEGEKLDSHYNNLIKINNIKINNELRHNLYPKIDEFDRPLSYYAVSQVLLRNKLREAEQELKMVEEMINKTSTTFEEFSELSIQRENLISEINYLRHEIGKIYEMLDGINPSNVDEF